MKVVLDAKFRALYFSRSPLPWWRDASSPGQPALPSPARRTSARCATSACTPTAPATCAPSRRWPWRRSERLESLEQLRVLWHGERIVVHIAPHAPPGGVDTAEDLARVRALLAGAND